jgi:hypothetical protein
MSGHEFEVLMKKYPAIKVIIVSAHDPSYAKRFHTQVVNVFDKHDFADLPAKIKALCSEQVG